MAQSSHMLMLTSVAAILLADMLNGRKGGKQADFVNSKFLSYVEGLGGGSRECMFQYTDLKSASDHRESGNLFIHTVF